MTTQNFPHPTDPEHASSPRATGAGQVKCSRRMFLLGTATTFAGIALTACGKDPVELSIADVPVGSAVIVDGVILAQPVAGEYKAYSTVCPHQNSQISQVDGDIVRCPTHNSEFSIVDGAVISGPARDPMKPLNVAVSGETATVG
ncbi:3-phenylpropionate/cinnamic acid dioxygenase ferredoxin subunit [Corynebacterium felinum]|uniref:Nitrite reductase/ring-hydroxylating ferredoxin subunit n=2 Tax=Corynebacterium felinum TaxID=131318 RepID=A0ABU2B6N4_9CORY|nr:nitrite reductase/ring-hydroxylating ferredoxin subunit [Corynebacterium felinum]WJY96432.1 3-phenylpropionate/cinnamic acid dioxygenase ferredoxin subunit [Corynebacterium felinum]